MMRCPSGLASPDPFLNVDASKERRVAPKNIVRVVLWMSGALLLFSAMAVQGDRTFDLQHYGLSAAALPSAGVAARPHALYY